MYSILKNSFPLCLHYLLSLVKVHLFVWFVFWAHSWWKEYPLWVSHEPSAMKVFLQEQFLISVRSIDVSTVWYQILSISQQEALSFHCVNLYLTSMCGIWFHVLSEVQKSNACRRRLIWYSFKGSMITESRNVGQEEESRKEPRGSVKRHVICLATVKCDWQLHPWDHAPE